MRFLRRSAQTATSPDLGEFRRIQPGQRVLAYGYGSAADSIAATAQLGATTLCQGNMPVESAAGSQTAGDGDKPLFDVVADEAGELTLAVTVTAGTYDLIIGVEP